MNFASTHPYTHPYSSKSLDELFFSVVAGKQFQA
jgi:hypothetical protein